MKIRKLITVLLFFSLLTTSACGQSSAPAPAEQPAEPAARFTGKYVVDADYVKSVQGSENVIIIDARGEEAAQKETVEGAIAFVWQGLALMEGKPGEAMWGTVLPAAQLAERLGEFGVDPAKEIILFSNAQDGWGEDGRIAWVLNMANYPNVKIVDGGINALKSAGVKTAKGAKPYEPCAVTVDSLNEYAVLNTEELQKDYSQYKIVDVRADEEYNGAALYGEAKGGHLPGAIHINFAEFFNDDNTIKSNDEIKSMLDKSGITTDDKIVTYCTAGIRSAHAQLLFEMCGYNAKNYDESFYRWSAVGEVEE